MAHVQQFGCWNCAAVHVAVEVAEVDVAVDLVVLAWWLLCDPSKPCSPTGPPHHVTAQDQEHLDSKN